MLFHHLYHINLLLLIKSSPLRLFVKSIFVKASISLLFNTTKCSCLNIFYFHIACNIFLITIIATDNVNKRIEKMQAGNDRIVSKQRYFRTDIKNNRINVH